MKLKYRNVYPDAGHMHKVRYGFGIFDTRKWANVSAGSKRIGIETIWQSRNWRASQNPIVIVFYQPTK